MPFVSQKQRVWMHANKPEMAKKWENETPKGLELPKKVSKTREQAMKKMAGGY